MNTTCIIQYIFWFLKVNVINNNNNKHPHPHHNIWLYSIGISTSHQLGYHVSKQYIPQNKKILFTSTHKTNRCNTTTTTTKTIVDTNEKKKNVMYCAICFQRKTTTQSSLYKTSCETKFMYLNDKLTWYLWFFFWWFLLLLCTYVWSNNKKKLLA